MINADARRPTINNIVNIWWHWQYWSYAVNIEGRVDIGIQDRENPGILESKLQYWKNDRDITNDINCNIIFNFCYGVSEQIENIVKGYRSLIFRIFRSCLNNHITGRVIEFYLVIFFFWFNSRFLFGYNVSIYSLIIK